MNRRRNSFGLRWNIFKHCFEIVTWSRLWSTVSKCGTHLADSFFIPNWSCKIEITAMWSLCLNKLALSLRSVKTISTLLMISGMPQLKFRTRCITCVRSRLNSFTQLYTVANADANMLRTLSNSALISFGVQPLCRYLITKLVFFHFAKNTKVVRFNRVYRNEIREMNSAQNLSNQLRDITCQKVMWHDSANAFLQIFYELIDLSS